jgi:hypothetical protein
MDFYTFFSPLPQVNRGKLFSKKPVFLKTLRSGFWFCFDRFVVFPVGEGRGASAELNGGRLLLCEV